MRAAAAPRRGQRKRLHEVVVRAARKAFDAVVDGVSSREHQYGQALVIDADASA